MVTALKGEEGVTLAKKVAHLLEVLKGVISLHSHNVFQISMKPENIMMDKDGRVKLVSLGVRNCIFIYLILYNTFGSVVNI